jgi:hypothetical protein
MVAQVLAIILVASLVIGWETVSSSKSKSKSTTGGGSDDTDVKAEFDTWTRKFGHADVYGRNHSLWQKRLSVFKANVEHIRRHNRAAGNTSYKLAVNRFADLTFDEVRSSLLLAKQPKSPPPELLNSSLSAANSKPLRAAAACNPALLPTNFDWRSRGKVTDVKDQGRCGSFFYVI